MKVRLAIMGTLGLAAIVAQSPAPRSVWDGVYTAEQSSRGQGLYNTQCAACHGDTLGGGESAPPLAGAEFLSNWSGLTVGDLFERTRTSMPQSKPGSLSREVNADILSYILSANQFPAGKTELPHAAEVLKEIRIEASKPEPK
ncbi:MAG TPA: cytochrome c [Bryobacteraceae bacterium]|nr:Cytochrome c, class I [Candidatus Sulfopaludibacter sp. SbA4]HYW44179.1 cytochrome c [Bryobacteraceae bacterium]